MITVAILGLGEAGSRFANDLAAVGVNVIGWDPQPRYELQAGVQLADNNAVAANAADVILSVNVSAVSESVAREVKQVLHEKQLYCEMNTSSPDRKQAIYTILQSSGVQYVDLAIMAPVPPKGIQTPFLASGPGAQALLQLFQSYMPNLQYLSDSVGDASTRKLLRSIVYKGIAAVVCEAVEAGKAFGLNDYIREQIASVMGGDDSLIDRFVEGSYTHAERRIHEMEAVEEMLQAKHIEPLLSTAARHKLNHLLKRKQRSL